MIAFFPGQGSQHEGMGKSLFENFSYVRDLFEEASEAIKLNIKKLCFDGPATDLTLTENTQPCLLVTSYAAFVAAEREWEFKPSLVMGHSLGEYSALVAAKSLRFAEAVRWVRARGQAMQSAVPAGVGGMAAVMGLDDSQVIDLCKKAISAAKEKNSSDPAVVEPANFNSPGQVVIAGSKNALDEAAALSKTDAFKGAKIIPLQVSAPFHSSLMKPARENMAELFLKLSPAARPAPLAAPYIPNCTARFTTEASLILELLEEQIDHPVLWTQSVETALGRGEKKGIEFGPGKVLQSLVKRIAKSSQKEFEIMGCGDSEGVKNLEAFL